MADSAKEVVTRFFETFSSGDVPAILDALDDGAVWWVWADRRHVGQL